MHKIGRVLHITPGKKAVVKVENLPKVGERVFDEKHNPVGKVFDIFGPTSSPYVEVTLEVEDPSELVDHFLYVLPSHGSRTRVEERKK